MEVTKMEDKKNESIKKENKKSGKDIRIIFNPCAGRDSCNICKRHFDTDEFQYMIGQDPYSDMVCDKCVKKIAPVLIGIKSDIKKVAYDLRNFDVHNIRREIKETLKEALNKACEQKFRGVVRRECQDEDEWHAEAVHEENEAMREFKEDYMENTKKI